MKPKKATTVRIRPFEGDVKIAQMIAERTGLALIDVMSIALQAGLKAIADDNYRLDLPLKVKVVPREEHGPTHPPDNPSLAFSSEATPPYRTTGRHKPKS